jgi:hypothetical protein
MKTSPSSVGLILGLPLAAGLAGCHSSPPATDYWLDVRNNTSAMVTVDVVVEDSQHYRPISEPKNIGPNSKVTMGPLHAGHAQPELQAQTLDDKTYPARFPLSPGLSVINITREEPKGKLQLQLAPRN